MQARYLLFFLCTLMLSCNSNSELQESPVIIIGGGLMGSSTAWQLARQGQPVLLIEKQDSIYTEGSSLGEARIARSSNRGNDIWSYLHNRSVQEVSALIDYLNSTGAEETYQMEDIYTTSPVSYVGRTSIYDKLMASLIRQEVEYEIAINPQEGEEKFDVLLPEDILLQREYNLHSGTINPKVLIEYLHAAIKQKGNTILYNQKVSNLQLNPQTNLFELELVNEKTGATQQMKAQKVVSAAGPYTGQLLSDVAPYMDTLIKPQRVFLAYFKIQDAVYQQLPKTHQEKLKSFYPVINSSTGTRMGSFFSMIEYYDDQQQPVIKVGGHFQRSMIDDLDQVWKKELSPEEIEWSQSSTARYLKLLKLPIEKDQLVLVNGYSCVYSLTNSEVPFVSPIMGEDRAPNPNFIMLGGMSGVGGKGAMSYGLIAANLLTGTNTEQDSLYQVSAKALGFERLVEDVYH